MKKRLIMISALVLALVLALFAFTACNNATSEVGEELVKNGGFTDFNEKDKVFEDWSTSSSSVKYGVGYLSNEESEQYLYIDNTSRA